MESHSWGKTSAPLLDFMTNLCRNFDCAYGSRVRYWPNIVVDVKPLLIEPLQWATQWLKEARSCPWMLWSKPVAADKMGDNACVTPLIGLWWRP
jgi:hypothetical protein